MVKVTVAVPFRGGQLDREVHAEYVQWRLRQMLPDARHLLVDVDGEFSRARVRNAAVRQAGEGVVVLCDADTVPEEEPLRAAIVGAAADGRLHLPYTRYRALSPEGTLAVYARGIDPRHAPVSEESRRPIGGVWVISTDAWWAAGGMDETFQGWGFEDDAFHTAANLLLGETVRHHGTITHLHHQPAANTRSREYQANKARYQRYVQVRRNPEGMRRLVGLAARRPLRIAAMAHYYLPAHRAGAEIMLHELLRPLAARGHQVTVYATDERADAVVDGVTVRARVPDRLGPVDVVISHLKSVGLARTRARTSGARLVQVLHSAAPWIGRAVAEGADLYVANTDHVAADLRARMRGPHVVVHPPVWAPQHQVEPGDAVTLVNPLPEKGAGVFYELARRMPDTPFLVVEGGYQTEQQIRPSGQPNITWQEHTATMREDVWARTRVLLMPSSEESYGMAAVEAAASGIPTLASDLPGLREALGDAGTYLPPDDVDAWETALRALLDGGWEDASKAAAARAAELAPEQELAEWVAAVEGLSR